MNFSNILLSSLKTEIFWTGTRSNLYNRASTTSNNLRSRSCLDPQLRRKNNFSANIQPSSPHAWTRTNVSLNIVLIPWLPFVNFHFSRINLYNYSVRQIQLQVSNHYSSFKLSFCQTDQASRMNRVSQKNTGLLPRMSKINHFPLFRKRC